MSSGNLGDISMLELFRMEVENQREVMTAGLLALERHPTSAADLEACMRAAHSIKGAARVVELHAGVSLAHSMEDCFVAAQHSEITLHKAVIDVLLRGIDLLAHIANTPTNKTWTEKNPPDVDAIKKALTTALESDPEEDTFESPLTENVQNVAPPVSERAESDSTDRVLRVTAQNLDRLLGLSGESLVESRWLKPFAEALLRLRRGHADAGTLDSLREALLEHDLRAGRIAQRLYDEALACRMRPFADGITAFPRMVRDVAHTLGKRAHLEIVGETTRVDRDVLEKLEAPLGHLLRNALDHGIGTPEERKANGKPVEGAIRLEARHSAGMLQISVSDDGRGIDLDRVRATVIARGLADTEIAGKLSEAELLEFLFLPGFTVKETVTEISGRGVGLDVVQNIVKQLHGNVRISSVRGQGTRFQLHLPLTLSVVRALLVEIGGEPYAVPLSSIVKSLQVPREEIALLEGRQHFNDEGHYIGLVVANQIFQRNEPEAAGDRLPVIVLGDQQTSYGLVVDRFLGIRELVVQPLDLRLGKIKDIAAGALLEDGSPLLIIDVDDVILSIEKLVSGGQLSKVQSSTDAEQHTARKRVLVVDDSLTVRELERKLIESGGYDVEVAVDGADGWNAVRTGQFNLVVTDIDMPRMDGIELVKLIKKEPRLQSLPVMIVSYKDREEDRQRGLEAGADFYLTKGSFHDETLLHAVVDLVGGPHL